MTRLSHTLAQKKANTLKNFALYDRMKRLENQHFQQRSDEIGNIVEHIWSLHEKYPVYSHEKTLIQRKVDEQKDEAISKRSSLIESCNKARYDKGWTLEDFQQILLLLNDREHAEAAMKKIQNSEYIQRKTKQNDDSSPQSNSMENIDVPRGGWLQSIWQRMRSKKYSQTITGIERNSLARERLLWTLWRWRKSDPLRYPVSGEIDDLMSHIHVFSSDPYTDSELFGIRMSKRKQIDTIILSLLVLSALLYGVYIWKNREPAPLKIYDNMTDIPPTSSEENLQTSSSQSSQIQESVTFNSSIASSSSSESQGAESSQSSLPSDEGTIQTESSTSSSDTRAESGQILGVSIEQKTITSTQTGTGAMTESGTTKTIVLPAPTAEQQQLIAKKLQETVPRSIVNSEREKNKFTDINNTSESIIQASNKLVTLKILSGYDDGTFRPEKTINRAEMAKIIVLARFGELPVIQNQWNFLDVSPNDWFEPYVKTAVSFAIVSGTPDGHFAPSAPVNTAEFLKQMSIAFGLKTTQSTYADVAKDAWYAPYAGAAEYYHLLPDRKTNLEPGRPMTRGEAAIAIYNLLTSKTNP